jgi:hypothetical protein
VVTITGTNFVTGATVSFGLADATNVTVNSATSLTATSPAGTGTVNVTVTTSGGTSATSTADQFTYLGSSTLSEASNFPVESAKTSAVTSVAATWVTVGDAVLVTFDLNYTGTVISVTSISAGKARSFTQLGTYTDTSGDADRHMEIWQGIVTTAGSDTVTISYSGTGTYYDVVVDEIHSTTISNPTWSTTTTRGSATGQSGSTAEPFNLPLVTSGTVTAQGYIGYAACSGSGLAGTTPGFTYHVFASTSGNIYAFDGALAASTPYQPNAYSNDGGGSPTETSIAVIISASVVS